jgi:hypothetical protein
VAAELHELLSITGEKPWKREIAAAIDQALHHGNPGISRIAKSGLRVRLCSILACRAEPKLCVSEKPTWFPAANNALLEESSIGWIPEVRSKFGADAGSAAESKTQN